MKRTYIILCLICLNALAFASCGAGVKPPAAAPEFAVNALYKTGGFSYTCLITRTEASLTVEATSTHAAGLKLTCDGDAVCFEKDGMAELYPVSDLDVTNPAAVLYGVFNAVFSGGITPQAQDGLFLYSGTGTAGAFTLSVNPDGSFNTLTLPQAGITVIFD